MADQTLFATFADLPALAAGDGDAPLTSRIQVAKVGTFKHPRYGKVKVTRAAFDSFIRNLTDVTNGEAPVDFDHEPEMGGPTAACGWIKQLDTQGADGQTPTPGELWATVAWTPAGAKAVQSRAYRYFSPTWNMNFVDDQGEDRGPTLIGGGLTNRPFFLRMAAVSLSATFSRDDYTLADEVTETLAVDPASETDGAADSRPGMSDTAPNFASIAEVFGLTPDATEDQVLTAARETRERADQAPAEGAVTFTKDEAAALLAKANAGEQAASELAAMRFDNAFTAAKTAGKVGDGQREHFSKIFAADEQLALDTLDSLQPVVATSTKGATGTPGDTPENVDSGSFDLHREVEAYMAEHDCDYREAFHAVAARVEAI